jgi:conjugal transfer/entry exclusion protein
MGVKKENVSEETGSEDLVCEAKQLLQAGISRTDTASPKAHIRRRLKLSVDQLERLDMQESALARQLTNLECYLETEMLHMEQRTPRYSAIRFPERERLQSRLQMVGEERRRLAGLHRVQRQTLEQELLEALGDMKAAGADGGN